MQTAECCKIGLVDGDGDGGQHGRGRLNLLGRRGHRAVVLDGDEGDVVGADEEVHLGLNYGMADGVGAGVGSGFLNGSDGDAPGEGEGGRGGGGVVVAAPLLAPAHRR